MNKEKEDLESVTRERDEAITAKESLQSALKEKEKEEEEYKKWESLISVESEGEDVKTSLLEDESRLSALLSALERRKVCVLDELSCELGVSNEVRVLEWCEL